MYRRVIAGIGVALALAAGASRLHATSGASMPIEGLDYDGDGLVGEGGIMR